MAVKSFDFPIKFFFMLLVGSCLGCLPLVDAFANESKMTLYQHVEVHNCILWSYRGSVVSLVDVVKKLDAHLDQQGAGESISAQERYEFYQQNWRSALQDLIDNELIYQDGLDSGRLITDAEAKDELVRLYGDQYLTAVDAGGMSLPDAIEMLKKELLIQRMYGYRVHYMASQAITPQMVAEAYKSYLSQNPATDIWQYRIVTLRGPKEKALIKAQEIKTAIESGSSLDNLLEKNKEKTDAPVKVTASGKLDQTTEQINPKIVEILKTLKPLELSEPIDFSKNDKESIYRLLLLEHSEYRSPLSIGQMQRTLEDSLRYNLSKELAMKYLSSLRKRLENEQGITFREIMNPTFSFNLFTLR